MDSVESLPHLLIVEGPGEGKRVPLERVRTLIGRGKKCDVMLKDEDRTNTISKEHALIVKDQGNYFIEDGDGKSKASHNHTYVNDVKLPFPGRHRLRHNDLIRICNIALRFYAPDGSLSSITASVNTDSSSVLLAQPAEKLQLVLEINNRLSNTLELDRLLPEVVDALLQLFKQADHGFLILKEQDNGALTTHVAQSRKPRIEAKPVFSESIIKKCLDTNKGLLVNEPRKAFPDSASIAGLESESFMCAPLKATDNRPFGVLLLDTHHVSKKFSEDDLKVLVAVANQVSIALANAHYHRDALARERLGRDLILAAAVVKSFLPEHLPALPGYEFFAGNQSASEVGGDYYDFIELGDQRLAILLGDVAGKGVPAALVMTRFSAEARTCLRTESDLAAAVGQLNARFQNLSRTDRFVTLAALVLDAGKHTITAVNAGHPSPILIRRATGALEDVSPRGEVGLPIGIASDVIYKTRHVELQPGDNIVLFSDGVTEAMNARSRQWGLKGLHESLRLGHAAPGLLAERVLQAVKKHATGCPQSDDITLVCFGRV